MKKNASGMSQSLSSWAPTTSKPEPVQFCARALWHLSRLDLVFTQLLLIAMSNKRSAAPPHRRRHGMNAANVMER